MEELELLLLLLLLFFFFFFFSCFSPLITFVVVVLVVLALLPDVTFPVRCVEVDTTLFFLCYASQMAWSAKLILPRYSEASFVPW